ncbi:putative cysteine-rich receptor-like protein kinase 20 [Neltuma alba]|uniref:putative cysteine-rich receptor-like protein kinase 20 n=1 Tax=Neltuma alba TaxID=207710 RepID=UPI0010A30EB6|nr:putative cysteine-rich receptor-like protein kinase 20 [Prosopis alba]
MLPLMKYGLDKKTGLKRFLASWKSHDDPRPGSMSYKIDPRGYPQFLVYKNEDPIDGVGSLMETPQTTKVFASSHQTPIKNKPFFNLAMITHRYFLLFLFIASFLCSPTIEAVRPTYLYHNCSTAGKSFSANSTFQSHRTTLLSSLASANAASYNTTIPGGSEAIYGLFMCRGDVSLQVCRECVANATQLLPFECRISKEAVIWYDECMLRYSNTSFFSTIDKWPTSSY